MSGAVRTSRREKLRRLAHDRFDLVVIGGGINGAGIAREAALRGLRTALIDKGDFASGTSSRSSKLIHGGLRYLEQGELALVLESSRERDLLRRKLAPHLVRPMPFFFPVYRNSPIGYWKLRAGLLAYDVLAGFRNIRRHRGYRGARAEVMEPKLKRDELVGGALYYDCATDDARLVLETVIAAEAAGALCLNYVSVEQFRKTAGRISDVIVQDKLGEGGETTVASARVVNASGPWLDRVRQLDDSGAQPRIRLTKGVHLVVPQERVGNRHAVVLRALSDQRVLFVIPWDEHVLIGTTDTEFQGVPDQVVADTEDVDYLLETVNHYFPEASLVHADVLSASAGLRPLVAPTGDALPSEISREDAIFESASGLISLGGGKLTTYRRVAIRVVERVLAGALPQDCIQPLRTSGTAHEPLPGAAFTPLVDPVSEVDDRVLNLLIRRYGQMAAEIGAAIRRRSELGEPLAPPLSNVAAEAWWGAEAEMAVRVEDVLQRRTQIALRSRNAGVGAAERTAREMGVALGWSGEEARRACALYEEMAQSRPARAIGLTEGLNPEDA